jgi:hypothetical protein
MSYSIAPQAPEILQRNLRMLSTQLYQQQQSLLVPSKLGQARIGKKKLQLSLKHVLSASKSVIGK